MTSRSARVPLALLPLTLLAAILAPASDLAAGTVVGQVYDREQGPVANLLVRLIPRAEQAPLPADHPKSTDKHPVTTTLTDIDGGFAFENVPPGRYLLIAGTIRAGMNVQPFTLVEGRTSALNLTIGEPLPSRVRPFKPMDIPPVAPVAGDDVDGVDDDDRGTRDLARGRNRNRGGAAAGDDEGDDDRMIIRRRGMDVGSRGVRVRGDDDDGFGDGDGDDDGFGDGDDDDRFDDDDDRSGDDDDDGRRELDDDDDDENGDDDATRARTASRDSASVGSARDRSGRGEDGGDDDAAHRARTRLRVPSGSRLNRPTERPSVLSKPKPKPLKMPGKTRQSGGK